MEDKFSWNNENTATVIAGYQEVLQAQGPELANHNDNLQALAESVGAKGFESVRRKLVLEKVYQKKEAAAPTAKREAKTADPLSWTDEKIAQAQELYEAKIASDGIAAANDSAWLNSTAAVIGVKGSKAMVGKLSSMGIYQKATAPRSVGGSKRVPKMTLIRSMASKLESVGFVDALESLEPLEVGKVDSLLFIESIIDRLVACNVE